MQGIILAAGKSTRTFPLTATKPKNLLKVAGKTIIEHTLSALQGLVNEAIIVVGYKDEMIRKFIGKKFGSISVRYIYQEVQDGNGSALLLAKQHLKDRFLVILGDNLYSGKDISRCLKFRYSILGKEVPDLSRFGQLVVKDGLVKELKEKPGNKNGIASTGVMVLDKEIFKHRLMKSVRNEYEITDYITFLLKSNYKVNYVECKDYWLPITYPWSLLDANETLLAKLTTKISGVVEKGVTVKGPLSLGKGSVIRPGSYIEGNVMIGEGCIIGPNCYIRGSTTIGNDSRIGNAVEVKNSLIGDNTHIGHLSYIGDSIIGDNVNIGAGTITANLRHDNLTVKSPVKGDIIDSMRRKFGAVIGDGVHTGINTSIYPGRKIWPSKTTLPGEIVRADIE